MSKIELYNADALYKLKDIPDKSINLILIDPPYNIKKAKWDTWKTVESYVEFMGKIFKECERVLKDNGSFYFFHNDFLQIVELQNYINNNTEFVFKGKILWIKKNFRTFVWKNPSDKTNLRSWFNITESIMYYTFQDDTGLSKISSDRNYFKTIKKYLDYEHNKSGIKLKDMINKFGSTCSHYFGYSKRNKTQFSIPTKEMYIKLQTTGCFNKPYEELRKEYEELRYVHNLDKNHNNVWKSKYTNSGKLHPTQKPIDIIERIIKTSSNKNDTVLDCFMGSGTTGTACNKLDRNFIGIELNEDYFKIAEKRIHNV